MGLPNAGMTFLEIGTGSAEMHFSSSMSWEHKAIKVKISPKFRNSIAWCQQNITTDHPNFEFYHFDAKHELYNPLGTKTSLDFTLPVPDRSVDRVALASVFTHLFENEIVHYLKEIARILKPDGLPYAYVLPLLE